MESNALRELEPYYFDRTDFVATFLEVFNGDEIFDVECLCQEHTSLYTFHLYYNNDTFYIIHLLSGTMISWYKHLGRATTCNKDGFTTKDLKEMLMELKEELNWLRK